MLGVFLWRNLAQNCIPPHRTGSAKMIPDWLVFKAQRRLSKTSPSMSDDQFGLVVSR